MSPDVAASTVLLVGVMLARISVTDVFQRYVKVSMGPWLLLSGVLLTALGLVMVVRALRRPAAQQSTGAGDAHADHVGHVGDVGDAHADHGHHHLGGDRVGWLLLAPVLALLLVAPPALGSFGVDRTSAVRVTSGAAVFTPLTPDQAPRQMTLLEADQRAWDRAGQSFGTVPVQLTGFVADGTEANGFRIARYQIACCAADAVASVVHVRGIEGDPPARDTWTTVTGTFAGLAPDGLPIVLATSVQTIPAPLDTYE